MFEPATLGVTVTGVLKVVVPRVAATVGPTGFATLTAMLAIELPIVSVAWYLTAVV
jgi:energy-converting hydrogenase Eha subunit E